MKIDTKDFKRYVSPVEFYNPPVETSGKEWTSESYAKFISNMNNL